MPHSIRRWTGFNPSRTSGSERAVIVEKRVDEVPLGQRGIERGFDNGRNVGIGHARSLPSAPRVCQTLPN